MTSPFFDHVKRTDVFVPQLRQQHCQGEITDKGYINQRAVLERRAARVDELYADDRAVILPSQL